VPFYRRKKRTRVAPKARSKEEKCITKWCKNRKALKYTRVKMANGMIKVYECFLSTCWKCHAKKLKERHPHTYVLNMIRHSARKRKLPFTLTIAEFKAFCAHTRYLELRGNKPGDYTIDRIDVNEGYHAWNIRVKTHEENSAEGADNTPRWMRGAASTDDQPVNDNEPF